MISQQLCGSCDEHAHKTYTTITLIVKWSMFVVGLNFFNELKLRICVRTVHTYTHKHQYCLRGVSFSNFKKVPQNI